MMILINICGSRHSYLCTRASVRTVVSISGFTKTVALMGHVFEDKVAVTIFSTSVAQTGVAGEQDIPSRWKESMNSDSSGVEYSRYEQKVRR